MIDDTPNNLSNLTQSQLLIWTGQQLNSGIPLYNVIFKFEFDGEINVSTFQQAFQILIDKSDAMRTVFEIIDDLPQRKVLDSISYKVEFLDFTDKEKPNQTLQLWIDERKQKNFDLSKCLFDAVLIKISAEKFIWYFNQHHLICDAWSVSVQYKLLADIYKLLSQDKKPDGFTIPKYEQYVEFEKENRLKLKNSAVGDYWENRLNLAPNPPKLYDRSVVKNSTASNRITIQIGKSRTKKLHQLINEKDFRLLTPQLTLFNIFATIIFAYLYRISNEQEIIVGTSIHNRITEDFKNTPGLFIDILPLFTNLENEDSFLSLFDRLKNETNGFLKNAKTGASNINLSKSFNVILNYITADYSDFNDNEFDVDWISSGHFDPHHHLWFGVYEFGQKDDFKISFDFNNAIIPESYQEQAIAHFVKLLDAFLADYTQPINDIDILSTSEKDKLFEFGNGTQEFPIGNQTILDIFSENLEKINHHTAVVYQDRSITFKELDEKSNQLAHHLIKLGTTAESRIGVFLKRSTDLIVSILAILKAGGAYVPLDAVYPQDRIEFILKDADIPIVISQDSLLEKLPKNDFTLVDLDSSSPLISKELKSAPKVEINPSNSAYVIYTSGSTGTPKGVINEHRGVIELVKNLNNHIYSDYENPLNIALIAPCVFDASVQQIFASLLQGHRLYIAPECTRFDGNELGKFYQESEIDISDGTPAHLRLLLQSKINLLKLPRHFIIGGEAMSSELIKSFQDKFKDNDFIITNIYGVAEHCVDSIAYDIFNNDEINYSFVPIGKPLAGERVYILNDANQLQPLGMAGEICLGGEKIGRGYLNLEDYSEKKFVANPFVSGEKIFKTGDIGYFLPDGNIQYLGRKDNQVNINGYRIELGEIESRLLAFKKSRPIIKFPKSLISAPHQRCKKCLVTKSHPNTTFDLNGVCNICREFDLVKPKALNFFKTQDDFDELIAEAKQEKKGEYDCLLLYSGGKDSSYVLYKLVEMGLKVLAFTFDNGFISKAAFDNIKRQTKKFGVDCIIEKTDKMNEIFIESLNSDNTVCSGCFKSLTAISTKIAQDKGINVIVTGLSRGQIFDTKIAGLLEEKIYETEAIEEKLLMFRKMFHAADDRTNKMLDVDLSGVEFEKIHFVDFFRYDNTPVSEIKEYLEQNDTYWQNPKDTGFCSSNCMMNDIGICVHSSQAGFHNYEAPLSWDVRLGISTREEVLAEVESEVDKKRVHRVLDKIGFYRKEIKDAIVIDRTDENGNEYLIAYFVANQKLTVNELRNHLLKFLPDYMIPTHFIQLEKLPLTTNGKIDRRALPVPDLKRPSLETVFVSPNTEIEEIVAEIWSEVLQIKKVGIFDDFLNLGGNSFDAIRVMTRLNDKIELELPLNLVFEKPTVSQLSEYLEKKILEMLEELDA